MTAPPSAPWALALPLALQVQLVRVSASRSMRDLLAVGRSAEICWLAVDRAVVGDETLAARVGVHLLRATVRQVCMPDQGVTLPRSKPGALEPHLSCLLMQLGQEPHVIGIAHGHVVRQALELAAEKVRP